MRTAVAEVPPHGGEYGGPNVGRFLPPLPSQEQAARWNRIAGNAGRSVVRLQTWGSMADRYPEPDEDALNRRVPGMSLTDADLAMLGPRIPEHNTRSATEAARLERILAALRKL